MKRKGIVAVLMVLVLIYTDISVYASEVSSEFTGNGNTGEMQEGNIIDEQKKDDENEEVVGGEGNSGSTIPETSEDILFSVSIEKLTLQLNEEFFFNINVSDPGLLEIKAENKDLLELQHVSAEEIDETLKENISTNALWYSVKGLAVGNTQIVIHFGKEERIIPVIIEDVRENIVIEEEKSLEESEYVVKSQDLEKSDTSVTFSGWKSEEEGIRYYGEDGQYYTGIAEIDEVLYYFEPETGYLSQIAQWIDLNGKKFFCNEKGVLYRNRLISFGASYYYMGDDGSVQTGIFYVDGALRYADPKSGIIQVTSGWISYNGKDYFADDEGILYRNQFISFGSTYYYLGSDGDVQKGTFKVGNNWYHSNSSTGALKRQAGWIEDGEKKYYANSEGVIYIDRILYFGSTWYYMGSDGSVQKGVVNAGGTLYYADTTTGIIQKKAGWIEDGDKKYYSNADGVLYKNQFIYFGTTQYYMGSDGSVQKGNQYINGQWYYFDEETGVLIRKPGWFSIGNNKYYQKADGTLATGYTDISGIRYYFNSEGLLASKVGIDVSYYQGNIDWNKVKAAGVEFVFIRAGYRGYSNGRLVKDSCFDQNVQGALAAGIDVGIYFFSQAVNVQEAREEATYTYNLIKNYNVTFPVAFDAEYATSNRTGRADHLSASSRTLIVNTFCSQMKSYGYTPMLYAGIYFMRDELQMNLLSNYQLWIPRYNKTLGYEGTYKCWQYSSEGRISGISGNVDLNVWLN